MNHAKNLPYFRRFSLGEIRDPILGRALNAWRDISRGRSCFDAALGLRPLFSNGDIMLPSATFIVADGEDPCQFLFGWFGQGFGAFGNRNFTGYRISDIPNPAYARKVAEILGETMQEREPAYHHVVANLGGELFDYHRLILPVLDHGRVDSFVTVSVSESYAYLNGRNQH